jgi:hypothetical protein
MSNSRTFDSMGNNDSTSVEIGCTGVLLSVIFDMFFKLFRTKSNCGGEIFSLDPTAHVGCLRGDLVQTESISVV